MSSSAAHERAPEGLRLGRYLPLSIAVTLAVIALPVVAVAQVGPARGVLAVALHVLAAVALSMVAARALALLWSRHQHSSDLVFADLLLWGWTRRFWAERRLEAASRSLAGPAAVGEDRAVLLRRLSALLEHRDPYTHGHSKRVARHAERIARGMGLSRDEVARVRAAALVHDIGKINVPRSILTKPGRLTDAEFDLVKRHGADGAVMVSEVGDPGLAAIVRHHHERLDGGGYPDGLAGHDIPIGARIIAVADTFDAITSARPYRKPRTHRQALEVVRREAGTQLDPDAVAAFAGYYAARGSVGWAAVLLAGPQRLVSGLGGVQSGLAAGAAPLAQTACGVGAAALIGACLAGPVLSEPAGKSGPRTAAAAAASNDQDRREDAPGVAPGTRANRAPSAGRSQPGADVDGGETAPAPAPRERVTLRTPAPRGQTPGGRGAPEGSGQGGGNPGSPSAPGGLPAAPEVPAVVPDTDGVLDPVTDVLPPQVEVPVPVPVPAPAIPLP